MAFEESSDIAEVFHAFDVGFDSSVLLKQLAVGKEVAKIEQFEENEINIGHVVADEEMLAAEILLNASEMPVHKLLGQCIVVSRVTFSGDIVLHVHDDSEHHLNMTLLLGTDSKQLGVVLCGNVLHNCATLRQSGWTVNVVG